MIELQLLDGFEVRRDGAAVTLPEGARRLVAFLALRRIHVSVGRWLAPDVVDLHEAQERARGVLRDGLVTAETLRRLCLAGELLPGWHDEWVILERERFRHLRLRALDALCETLVGAGRYHAAIEAGRAAVAAEPLRESANRLLISAYLAAGDRREGLRRYRGFRDLLEAELALAPSRELEELVAPLPVW